MSAFVLHEDGLLEAKLVRDDPGLYMSNFGGLLASAALGRFLYVSGATLRTYLLEIDGTLRPYAETVAAPGLLAVTVPPSP